MSIFFDFKTVNELMGDNYYRQVKQDTSKFTPDDWIRYIAPLVTYASGQTTQGMNKERLYQKIILLGVLVGLGKTPQEAISQVQEWQNTGASQLLKSGTSTGVTGTGGSGGMGIGGSTGTSGSMGTQGNIGTSAGIIPTNRQVKQDTSKFTPDDWIRYIAPLVTYASGQTTQGMNKERLYQKIILLGVLVGLGKTPQEAISQVQEWQNTGASQLLKSGTSTGFTGTGGSGGMGIGGSTGTSGSMGTQGNIGTSAGIIPTNRQVKQDTSKFTPDDWIRYINPLVTYALGETMQGMNTQHAYEKFILLGVLVGLGKTPQEAISQVQEWQNTGASQLLKSGTSTGTSGNTNKINRLYFD